MAQASRKTAVMLFTNSFLPHQGRFQRVYNEARSLVDHGWRVVILAWDRTASLAEEEEMDGIEIKRIKIAGREKVGPVIALRMLAYMWKALRYVLANRVDVVHCHNMDVTLLGWILKKLKKNLKLVYDFCEPDYYTYWDKKWASLFLFVGEMEKALVKRCDCLLVHNHYQLDKYAAIGVENLVHIGSYPFAEMIVDAVPERDRDEVVIGRIGTIYENNGIEEIVAAFKVLMPRYPGLRLLLAGRVLDVYKPTFDALIAPIRDRVELIGAFNSADMPRLYAEIDISLMVYVLDDWFRNITPTKFFDSLACGVPVIISDMGRIRELMGDRACGVVVESLEAEHLAAAVEAMIADPAARRTMAQNGLDLIKTNCNWDLMEKRLLDAYGSGRVTKIVFSS